MAVKIVSNKNILGGKPIVAGTRIPVEVIMNLLGSGGRAEEILAEYPTLTQEAILSAIKYAAAKVRGEKILSISRRGNGLEFGLPS